MTLGPDDYPLFPLATVLFPGDTLSLRIFEPRYLAMVRDCSHAGRAFGVVLAQRNGDSADGRSVSAIGTLAKIVDFDTLPDGLLGIRCVAQQRFEVESAQARADGLLIGRIQLWADEDPLELPPEYFLLARLAQGLVENLLEDAAEPSKDELDSASWVGFRLAGLLPFSLSEKQTLLELRDPSERLQRVVEALPRFRSTEGESTD